MDKLEKKSLAVAAYLSTLGAQMKNKLSDEKGQGTTEYAILLGFIVIIGVVAAIVLFGNNLKDLWDQVNAGMNSILHPGA